jgi:hypothetical protein
MYQPMACARHAIGVVRCGLSLHAQLRMSRRLMLLVLIQHSSSIDGGCVYGDDALLAISAST